MENRIATSCPYCHDTDIQKNGFSNDGIQRWLCKTCNKSFQLAYKARKQSDSNKIYIGVALFFCLFAGIALLSGLYFLNMPDKNYSNVKADYTLQATALLAEFEKNEAKANQKYMDKVIDVNGTIAEITKDQKGATVVALRNKDAFSGVLCTLTEGSNNDIKSYAVGKPIKIRGVCTGMLMDVVLNKAVVVKE